MHSLSKWQLSRSDCSSSHSNLSEPRAFVQRGSNESNPNQTALSAAFSGSAEVRRGSNELNHDQTTLTAACSGCAEVLERFE